MTITVKEWYSDTVAFESKNTRFIRRFGNRYIMKKEKLVKEMQVVAEYVNNVLKEECLFEVE